MKTRCTHSYICGKWWCWYNCNSNHCGNYCGKLHKRLSSSANFLVTSWWMFLLLKLRWTINLELLKTTQSKNMVKTLRLTLIWSNVNAVHGNGCCDRQLKVEITEVQSQQMAFTHSLWLSNNPKILQLFVDGSATFIIRVILQATLRRPFGMMVSLWQIDHGLWHYVTCDSCDPV